MTNNLAPHALPLILEYTRAIEALVMDDCTETRDEVIKLTYSDDGGIDWEEPEIEEGSDAWNILMTLREIAIALID